MRLIKWLTFGLLGSVGAVSAFSTAQDTQNSSDIHNPCLIKIIVTDFSNCNSLLRINRQFINELRIHPKYHSSRFRSPNVLSNPGRFIMKIYYDFSVSLEQQVDQLMEYVNTFLSINQSCTLNINSIRVMGNCIAESIKDSEEANPIHTNNQVSSNLSLAEEAQSILNRIMQFTVDL